MAENRIWLLLAHLRYHFKPVSNATDAEVVGILRLPKEMILEVIDHLELHDLFILSQTCKALRALAWRDWDLALDQMRSIQRTDFLTGIAYVRPNNWACRRCSKLHAVNERDVPYTEWHIRGYLPSCCHETGIYCGPFYELRYNHVQMALKLGRMGNVNRRYLDHIMKPYSDERKSNIHPKLLLHTRAIPKIVAERFLLHAEYKYRDGTAPVSPNTLKFKKICPHMKIWPSRRNRSNRASRALGLEGLSDSVHLAFDRPGQEISGHCDRCPTDYTVVAAPGVLTIRAWHDLGPYTSPRDIRWKVHVPSYGNRPSRGPAVQHNLGSVREMYVEG
ncbi:f-box domain containing protein [Colletotrichum musicola]|uniref:F-box domain containing protein n=1 Tax=Colletotrichum musicola TaxID=2175873 RepID=A0A8H6MUX2_9PEZI|nr:f-box domain containing protein [Colletotrichum musicola]